MKTMLIIISIFTFYNHSNGQNYLLANEKIIYSFNTMNGKRMVLAKDSTNKYIVYRFGTQDKIELEFPKKTKDSWSKFTYSFYMRGGGEENMGEDLNYVYFFSGNFQYIIYDTYYAVENESACGIKVADTAIDIKGDTKTTVGNLVDFRFNNLIKISDKLPDEN